MPDSSENDMLWMRRALEEAMRASENGEVPIGAVIVRDGRMIASGFNQVEGRKTAMAHAEMLAMAEASAVLGDWRLDGCTLYVTKEPCAMCAGAAVNARLERLVFGVPDRRSGGAGGALDITSFPGMLHQVQVAGGVLAEECLAVLQDFFRRRREAAKGLSGMPKEAES